MIRIKDNDVDTVLKFIDVDNAGGPVYEYEGEPFTGIIESFYPNGSIQDEAEFTNGHLGGVQREYFENGQLKSEYKKYFAKPDGDFKIWDETGELIHHSVWQKGERIETIVSS
jgi:antitoxin component YwqK of YwqJK toxin-antitoxin module